MIVNGTGSSLLQLDGINQIDDTAVGIDLCHDTVGTHTDQQRAKLHLVERLVGDPLLENHLRIQFSCTFQFNPVGIHLKRSPDTGHTGQFAFFIANFPVLTLVFHGTFRHQFQILRLLVHIRLTAQDGEHNGLLHL